jgi:hypothetical protein
MNMPNINEMIPSKYLKQDDCEPPILCTIRDIKRENLAKEGDPAEHKYVMYFSEYEKGMALNKTNIEACAEIIGSGDTDDWLGKSIVLYKDANVTHLGKRTGGIRIRAARNQGKQLPKTNQNIDSANRAANDIADMESDIPF